MKELSSNITGGHSNQYYYNKRNDFSTVYDDKKILERRAYQQGNEVTQHNQHKYPRYSPIAQTPYNLNYPPVKTNVMPTTSSSYGAYHFAQNKNKDTHELYY